MANTLKPKRSSVAGNIPTTTNLTSGELGVNMADQKVWINNGTSVVQIGSGKLSGLADVVLSSLATGQGLSWNGTNWVNSSAGSGTVTSVAWNLPSIFSTSGSPVTTSGTLTATLASQAANTIFAAPNGAAGTPSFRALVAADVPTLNQSTTGNAATATALQTARTINNVSFNGSANITIPRLMAIDDRTAAPADGSTGYVTFGFGSWGNNNTSPYADFMLMRSYTDSSGGNDNMVAFRKDAIGMRIWQGGFGSATAFGTVVDVLHSGNYTSYSPTLTGSGATGTWGINVTGSASNISNTGTVTLASAGESNSIFITAPSYTTDNPVKLLNFDWYGNVWSLGNIRSGDVDSNGFGVYYTTSAGSRTEIARFGKSGNLRLASGLQQGNNLARPLAEWSASGNSTGMVYIELPGANPGNYGMIHAVIDVYEYNANAAATIIIGGHNWNGSWYNVSANVIGATNKQVRLAVRNGKFVICLGDASSVWEYGTVMLRKIHNGSFYNNIIDMGAQFVIAQTTSEGLSGSSGDIRALRTPASFNANGAITQAGNQVLHAANYTSYSPSLTGSGASGTWSINITGNAGSLQGYQWNSSGKDIRGSDIYADSWLRNYNSGTGLYNQATGNHWYSDGQYWNVGYGGTTGIRLRNGHAGTILGYLYAETSGNFGLLHNGGGWAVQVYPGGGGYLHGTWNGANIRANRAAGNLYIDDNYGCGIVGTYASTRYQGVFAMGDSYKLPADGTATGSLYGMAWSHPNAGGAAGNLTDHGLLIINNGGFRCAISNSIVASANITAYSDERLKTNWRDMPEDFVARLAKVKVGIYDRLDEENVTQVGVSAQSFQKLLPQAIMTAKDEMSTLSVSYGNAALASAVELAKDNVDLRARVAKLEALVSKLIEG